MTCNVLDQVNPAAKASVYKPKEYIKTDRRRMVYDTDRMY